MFTRALHRLHNRRRRLFAPVGVALALIAAPMVLMPFTASATIADSPFDGSNGVIDAAAGPVYPDLPSGSNDNSYVGGSKEDTSCPGVTTGSIPPNKDDLLGFYVATGKGATSGDTYLYLAWTRANVLGTATMDFELNKSMDLVDCNGVNAVRTAGDLLFTYDFQGGQVDAIQYRTWGGSSWSDPPQNILQPGVSEGSINADMLSGEMVVDMEAAGIFQRNVCQNFAGASLKSRASSSSFEDQLKDFIASVPKTVSNCGDLVVSKVTTGGTGTFTFHVDCDGTAYDQDVHITNTGSVTIHDIPFGTHCTVNEVADPLFTSVRTPSNGSVTIAPDPVTVSFTNTRNVGDLVVSKVTTGGTGTFTFHVDCDGTTYDQDVHITDSGSVTIHNIPTGTHCTVSEVADPLFTSARTPSDGSVTIGSSPVTVSFTNTRNVGDLVVAKTTTGGTGTFTFHVDCDGSAFDQDVHITNSGSVTIHNIPTGTHCSVSEVADPLFTSTRTPSDGSVTIGSAPATVSFLNTRNTAGLTVSKVTSGGTGVFTFHVDCDGTTYDQDVTIDTTGSQTIDGIPTGTHCTVTEVADPLYTSTRAPADGAVTVGPEGATVSFTNVRKVGDLVVSKTTVGGTGTFTFHVDCDGTAFDQDVHITDSGTRTISGIPTTTHCTVTEVPDLLFTSQVSPADGTVSIATGSNTVAFTNTAKPNGISVDKTVNGEDTSADAPLDVEVGSLLSYQIVITNSGQVPLSISALSDSLKADLAGSCSPSVETTLDPGETVTCSYTTTAADPGGTSIIHNTVTVAGLDVFERPAGPASDETFVHVLNPAIHLDKAADRGTAHVGDTITYTLTVTNPGNTPLTIVRFDDDVCDGAATLVSKDGEDSLLDPGETWVYRCSHLVVDGDPKTVVNTATVTGVDQLETRVHSTDDASTDILRPAIAVTKTGTSTVHVGDPVVYTIVVTNPGDTPLADVKVTDPKCDGDPVRSTDDADGLLSPGEAWTYHCTHVATAADGASILNTVKAEGTDQLGETVNNTGTHTAAVLHPAITIDKTADPVSVSGSGSVTYTYVVTNTGDTTLFNVLVTDDILGPIGQVASLDPGQSVTLYKTVDVDTTTPPTNVGTVVGTDVLGEKVTANDSATITVVLAEVATRPEPAKELPRTGAPLQAETRAAITLIEVGLLLELSARRRRRTRRQAD